MSPTMIGICVLAALAVLGIIIGVPLGLYLPRTKQFRANFMYRCEKFMGEGKKDYCQNALNVFEGAYVGRHKCDVPVENYNSLMSTVKFDHPCSQMTLWSDTKDLVSRYTKNNPGCFNLEKTLLGFVLDGQSWCGKEGSKETFTKLCPESNGCVNSSYRSFWRKTSAQFADYACGEVTAMLNGGRKEPFDPNSCFALEVKNLRSSVVSRLNVVLVDGKESMCNSKNLQALWAELNMKGINHNCKPAPRAHIKKCKSSKTKPCGVCLF